MTTEAMTKLKCCAECGVALELGEKTRCRECQQRFMREYIARRRIALKRAGKCPVCAVRTAKDGKVTCQRCISKIMRVKPRKLHIPRMACPWTELNANGDGAEGARSVLMADRETVAALEAALARGTTAEEAGRRFRQIGVTCLKAYVKWRAWRRGKKGQQARS